ncbi:MAG: hypothetical protein BGO01_01080 [Armatimonadetes bacterium 55-13]|nr:MAG: hypothetical protein BGO01_01080 [Armatimonadetes bacterium 55-13]
MKKELSTGGIVVAVVAGIAILGGVAYFAMSGGPSNVSNDQVKAMQNEARSDVPKGLKPLTKEEAQEGLMTMGGAGKGKH